MANPTNVIGQIAGPVAEFVRRWTQSPSIDYDTIAAATFDSEWAHLNSPVITTVRRVPDEHNLGEYKRVISHTLYTAFRTSEPNGEIVRCHYGCRVPISAKARRTVVRLTCTGCSSRCSVAFKKRRPYSALEDRDLAAVEFPRVQHEADWEKPKTHRQTIQFSSGTDEEESECNQDPHDVDMEDVDLFGEFVDTDSDAIPAGGSTEPHPPISPAPSTVSYSTSSSVSRVERELSMTQPEPSSSHS